MATMGHVYLGLGFFGESRRLIEQSLGLRERLQGPDHPDVGRAFVQLGKTEIADGRFDQATRHLQSAESILERSLGPAALDVGWALYWQGMTSTFRGDAATGSSLASRAQAIFERQLGSDSLPVGWCHNDLGGARALEGRFEEAAAEYRTAREIKSRHLAPDHPDLATADNNLGLALLKLGRFDEARPLIERGVAIAEASLGPDHVMTGLHLHSLGELYRMTQDPRARPVLERAADIQRRAVSGDSPELAQNYLSLARLDRDEGNDRWGARQLPARARDPGVLAGHVARDDDPDPPGTRGARPMTRAETRPVSTTRWTGPDPGADRSLPHPRPLGEGGMGDRLHGRADRAGPAPGRAEDHQAGHGHRGRSSPASRPSARRWR